MKYCRKEDDVFCHTVMTKTKTKTNTQIHKYKYTNTACGKVPERPNMWHIFEKGIVQGYQKLYSYVSNAHIHTYKYTNTQIQQMMRCQKSPTCGIFLKRGLFKDIKNYIQGLVFPVSGFSSLNHDSCIKE